MSRQKELACDVLVAGGGLAGVACAIAAARLGVKVILCHDRPVLGGNASSEIRMHVVGADASGDRGKELQTEAREGGIVEEIRLDNCVGNPQRSASVFDLILYDKCRREPSLTLMLNTAVVDAETSRERITHAIAERPSTEESFRISAKVFVDCTGDGRLGASAGATFRRGREAADEFGEALAPETSDGKCLGSTLLFQARKHDCPMPFVAPPWVRNFTEDDLKHRSHATAGADSLEYGYWWVEWGGLLDTIADNETIRDELLAIMLGVWDHIKNGGDHGAENWALQWFGFLPGKRESRRFVGRGVLAQSDLMESRAFEDAIAYGGWPIDIHPPGGIDGVDERPTSMTWVEHLYDIPLRSCVSGNIANLMFAGRNISCTHVAFASTRVMATCAAVGQGVGTAAAFAVKSGRDPADLSADHQAMGRIQQRLLRDDAFLIGRANSDSDDLARGATVTASSEQQAAPAANVISGQTRAVHGRGGAPAGRANPGTHRWMSDPADGPGAWLELRWESPVMAGQIELIFDTGLHRVLTLTHSDSYAYVARMQWGRPQAETVRDYHVEYESGGKWLPLVEVKDNYQRRRVHKPAEIVTTCAIRVVVTQTNGLDHARICEIRVYSNL